MPVTPSRPVLENIKVGPAQQPAEVYGECADLIRSKCPTEAGDMTALAGCLERNRFEGSAQCQDKIRSINRVIIPCDEDIRTQCADAGTGGGRIYKCLREKESMLTKRCRDALAPSGQ